VLGGEYEARCRRAAASGATLDPATLSDEVFGDTQNRYDFSRCPVKDGTARPWVCGDGSRPAYEAAQRWLREAKSAPDLCTRVFEFCVAATYYADSESSLHQVKFISNGCDRNIEESVDRAILAGNLDWSASQICVFNNNISGLGNLNYRQRMGESASTVNRVIAALSAAGAEVRDAPYSPTKGVVLLANTVDLAGASGFIEYLRSRGVKLIVSDTSGFNRLKYNTHIIILGGQNSPEGVGAVAASVLSAEEEESLLKAGAAGMFIKDGEWSAGQKVVVLAGNEAADTVKAWGDNVEKVLEAVL